MLTNLVASIVVSLVTNTTERWPQKQVQEAELDYSIALTSNPIQYPHKYHSENDTNADIKSVEFTVTGQRLLFFEFEGTTVKNELTNWTEAHWLVNMDRVRTNVYRSCPAEWIVQADNNPSRDSYMTDPGWTFDHTDHGWVFDRKATNYWKNTLTVPLPIGPFQTMTNGLVYWLIGTNICYDLPVEFRNISR